MNSLFCNLMFSDLNLKTTWHYSQTSDPTHSLRKLHKNLLGTVFFKIAKKWEIKLNVQNEDNGQMNSLTT